MLNDRKCGMNVLFVVLTIGAMAGAVASARAEEAPAADGQGRMAARFAKADKNKDGALTLEEAQAGMPKLAEHFSAIDADGNGAITLEELKQARGAMQR